MKFLSTAVLLLATVLNAVEIHGYSLEELIEAQNQFDSADTPLLILVDSFASISNEQIEELAKKKAPKKKASKKPAAKKSSRFSGLSAKLKAHAAKAHGHAKAAANSKMAGEFMKGLAEQLII